MKTIHILFLFISLSLLACKTEKDTSTDKEEGAQVEASEVNYAMATLESKSDSELTGLAKFTEEKGEVSLVLTIENATPGMHAAHLHETGDCASVDGTSAGGHWNPTDHDHGKWGKGQFHKGDIGNIEVGEDGTGSISLTTDLWSIGGDDTAKNILGRAVIVHAQADDFESQPSGAAGARQGCGVVVLDTSISN